MDEDKYARAAYEARFCTKPLGGKVYYTPWEVLNEQAKDVWRTVANTVIDTWEGILR